MIAFRQATLARLTLLINHVLVAEPAAMQRLAPHAGRSIDVELADGPPLLPVPVPVRWSITRAGLVELTEVNSTGDGPRVRACVRLRELGPWLQALQPGTRPPITIEGDSALANDLDWVVTHVRWDIADDLARLIGDAPAQQLARIASRGVEALQRFVAARPR